jgi:urea transporter
MSGEPDVSFPIVLLRGSGQILFQPSALTGAAFLLLVLWQSPPAAGACIAGLFGATLSAMLLERSSAAYADGSGGFNGALLGQRALPSMRRSCLT